MRRSQYTEDLRSAGLHWGCGERAPCAGDLGQKVPLPSSSARRPSRAAVVVKAQKAEFGAAAAAVAAAGLVAAVSKEWGRR